MRRRSRRPSRGPASSRSRSRPPARPEDPLSSPASLPESGSAGRPPWQVFDCRIRVGPVAAHSPPDDGLVPCAARWPTLTRVLSQLDNGPMWRIATSAASGRGSCSNKASWIRTSPRDSVRSRSRPFSARARQAPRGAPRAAQGGAPRPANGRRPREHLRRRGALVRAAASAAAGRQPRPRRAAPPAPRDPEGPRARDRAPGLDARDYRLPDGASGTMQHEFRAYGRWGSRATAAARRSRRSASGGRGTWFCPHCQVLP